MQRLAAILLLSNDLFAYATDDATSPQTSKWTLCGLTNYTLHLDTCFGCAGFTGKTLGSKVPLKAQR